MSKVSEQPETLQQPDVNDPERFGIDGTLAGGSAE
ncbi:hypothetical protein ACJ72_07200 [Emergomyces africanus]|uniref:Uncharacterized protein n=1 Tax=Emergomyces africanus TaxID=1955775 RepID=A0A1B7NNV5_9EURO|nr:hypothetical protein ACJ72_07200 [Emergomyces africanus]